MRSGAQRFLRSTSWMLSTNPGPLRWFWSGARRAPRCSVGGEQLDNAIGSNGAHLGAGPCAPPRFARPLRDGEFQQLDGSEIADIAAHTLGGVEQHMRLGAE